jgi:flagellar protein FliS
MALKGINAYKKGNLKHEISQADPHKLTLMLMQGILDRLAYTKVF